MSEEESHGTTGFAAGSSSQSGKRYRCASQDSTEEPLEKQPKPSKLTENFNALFQRLEHETFISLPDMNTKDVDFFGFIHDNKLPNFLVCESFKELLVRVKGSLESSQTPIVVRGPKGVGKTTSLIALHSLLKSFVDVVYVNDKALKIMNYDTVGKQCIKDYYDRFRPNGDICWRLEENERKWIERLMTELTLFVKCRRFYESKALILVDLSKCDNTDDVQFISDVCCGASSLGVCVVLSISSGEELKSTNATVPLFDKFVPKCGIVYFQPFSDSEVKEYLAKNNVQFNFELDLKHLTGYNPFLLEMATTEPDLLVLDDRVSRFVKRCFTAAKSSTGHDYLVRCIASVLEYFYMAANEIPLLDKRRFRESWVCQQGVCYIADKENKQYVMINFPTAPDLIMHEIDWLLQNDAILQAMKHIPQAHGYLLQREFFEYARQEQELHLDKCGTTGIGGTTVIGITCVVDFVDILEDANQMQYEVLYRLRSCHPAIDAIMKLDETEPELMFFKISERKYGTYGNEVGNLMERKYTCKELQQGHLSLFEYYKSIAKVTDNARCYYVFLSTETSRDAETSGALLSVSKLKNDADKFNIGYGLLMESDLYKRFKSVMY